MYLLVLDQGLYQHLFDEFYDNHQFREKTLEYIFEYLIIVRNYTNILRILTDFYFGKSTRLLNLSIENINGAPFDFVSMSRLQTNDMQPHTICMLQIFQRFYHHQSIFEII